MGQCSGEFFQLTARVESRRTAQKTPASKPNPYIGAATSGSTAPYRMTPEKRASATEITVALAKTFLIQKPNSRSYLVLESAHVARNWNLSRQSITPMASAWTAIAITRTLV